MKTHVTLRESEGEHLRARVAELEQRIVQLTMDSGRDWLLGLPNRRAFEEQLREEFARTRRSGRTFVVAMLDIDGLKRVNDTYGHAAGDQALLFVASSFRVRLRQVDFVARWGGDEFAVIMPDTDKHHSEVAIGRIQSWLDAQHAPRAPTTKALSIVSFSFGVADARAAGSESTLIRRADEAMYRQKKTRTTYREGVSEMPLHSSRIDQQSRGIVPDSEDPGASQSHVLLAEDDRELRRMLAGELRKDGFVVKESGTGFELLEHLGDSTLRAQPIDLIVTDVRMPGVSGLTVVDGLRSGTRSGGWATPIILITAFADAETHAEASRLGAVLLSKPFDVDEFRACARGMVDPKTVA